MYMYIYSKNGPKWQQQQQQTDDRKMYCSKIYFWVLPGFKHLSSGEQVSKCMSFYFIPGVSAATIGGVVVAVLFLTLLIMGGVWFFYAYTHPTSASGQWMINVSVWLPNTISNQHSFVELDLLKNWLIFVGYDWNLTWLLAMNGIFISFLFWNNCLKKNHCIIGFYSFIYMHVS